MTPVGPTKGPCAPASLRGRTDEASLPATQSAFYELICIGWLALAATSLWIAILY